jgi:hypothetical protein
LSQKAKDFNKLEERNGSLYVNTAKGFKHSFDINDYVEKSVRWAFAQKYFKNKNKEKRTPKQIICDATQGKIGEFAVYRMLKERGYNLEEPDYTSVKGEGEWDDGDLFLERAVILDGNPSINKINIQIKTNTSKNNLFKLKKEEFDLNGNYHNWGNKKPILYTYFFMCRINIGVRNAFESLGDSEFNIENVLKFIPNINFRIEVTGFININDFRKIIAEDQFIPAKKLINNSYSLDEDYYYCQSGDLREIDEIAKKK